MKNLDDMPNTHNWDSYGGRPTSEAAINTARRFQYVPLSNGGIDIELSTPKADVQIEIDPDGSVISVFCAYKDEKNNK